MIGIEFNSGLAPDTPRRLVAVHHRQLNIHQDQVGARSRKGRQRVLTAFGFDQLVPGVGKQIAQDTPVVLLVLNDQDAACSWLTNLSFDRHRNGKGER